MDTNLFAWNVMVVMNTGNRLWRLRRFSARAWISMRKGPSCSAHIFLLCKFHGRDHRSLYPMSPLSKVFHNESQQNAGDNLMAMSS